jgi:hypothetical protein
MSARGAQTSPLLETEEGPTLLAAGGAPLTDAQLAMAEDLGLTYVEPGEGAHAEEAAIWNARELRLTPYSARRRTACVQGDALH